MSTENKCKGHQHHSKAGGECCCRALKTLEKNEQATRRAITSLRQRQQGAAWFELVLASLAQEAAKQGVTIVYRVQVEKAIKSGKSH